MYQSKPWRKVFDLTHKCWHGSIIWCNISPHPRPGALSRWHYEVEGNCIVGTAKDDPRDYSFLWWNCVLGTFSSSVYLTSQYRPRIRVSQGSDATPVADWLIWYTVLSCVLISNHTLMLTLDWYMSPRPVSWSSVLHLAFMLFIIKSSRLVWPEKIEIPWFYCV